MTSSHVRVPMCAQHQMTDTHSDSDNRYFPRWPVRNHILYRAKNHPNSNEGHTKDLSCAGTCAYVNEILPIHQKLNLTVHLSKKTVVELQGVVVWQNTSTLPYQAGIEFYNTSDETLSRILQHAFEIDRTKMLNHWFEGWK